MFEPNFLLPKQPQLSRTPAPNAKLAKTILVLCVAGTGVCAWLLLRKTREASAHTQGEQQHDYNPFS